MIEHRDLLGEVIEVGDTVVYTYAHISLYTGVVVALLPKTVRLDIGVTTRKPKDVLIIKKHNAGVQ